MSVERLDSDVDDERVVGQLETKTPDVARGNDAPEPLENHERSIQGIKWALVVVGILASIFLFALDNTIVADVQPDIINAFPGSVDKLPWISVAFALGGAATTLVWASLFGTFDNKWLFIIAVTLFEIGSALCGAAPKIDVLILGRSIAGWGGAGTYVGGINLLSAVTTAKERPLYIASTGLSYGFGSVLGPVIGGAFADSSATWRWAFYINLVIAAVFAPVLLLYTPSVDPQPTKPMHQRASSFDYVGAFLIVAAFAFGTTGLSFGGSLYAWGSATIIVTLVLSVVLFILFGIQQGLCLATSFERRLLPVQYFRNRTLILMFLESAQVGSSIFIPIYFIPLFFQFTKGDRALDAAVRLLPFIFLLVFFSLVNGGVMGKEGHYMPWYIIANVLIIVGSALMYTVDENTGTAKIYGYSIILAAGAGCIMQASFIVAQAIVPRSEMSAAVAFVNLAQIGGLVIALTLANTIFLNVAQQNIAHVLPTASASDILAAISGTSSGFIKALSPELQRQVLHAIVKAIDKSYILCIAGGAMGLVLAFFMKTERVFLEM